MSCSCASGAEEFFSKRAGEYSRKYKRRGLDAAQRALSRGLQGRGLAGKSVLEIGCGIGGLHLELLKEGASRALGIDVSSGMIREAEQLAADAGLADRVDHRIGDFADLHGEIGSAAVVVLDKVLCCYADPAELIAKSTEKSSALYAVSFPRDGLLAKVGFKVPSALGRLFGLSFYPFYHSPAMMIDRITEAGFRDVYSSTTPLWQIKVFERISPSAGRPSEVTS